MVTKRLFLSWWHDDEALQLDLVEHLTPCLKILKGITIEWWQDSLIRTGERWRPEILERLDECHYGLLLLSPGFYASPFITEHELPKFIGPNAPKGALPVALHPVPLKGPFDLRGVDEHQIFTDSRGRAYSQLRRPADRTTFAVELASAIADRLDGDAGGDTWRRL